MKTAPHIPTTDVLLKKYPLSCEGKAKVMQSRKKTIAALASAEELLVIIGPCAMTDNLDEIIDENRRINEFAEKIGVTVLHRLPPWKPRTNPEDWHGLETYNPEAAFRISIAIAEQSGNFAMEFGHEYHVPRYIGQAALAWRGSRNENDSHIVKCLAGSDKTIPIAVKNRMNGRFENNCSEKSGVNDLIPIFRGGNDIRTPREWMNNYLKLHRMTNSRIIVDAAHGSEQAYDPKGAFLKSALGQIACLEDLAIAARATGRFPRGIMIEASDITSPTDPVVPLDEAFDTVERFAALYQESR